MDHSVEIKLVSLFKLQQIESEIDRLRTYRGELPMEVRDLEDELAGMETRLERQNEELSQIKRLIAEKEAGLKEAQIHKGKYEEQLKGIRNSREFDALSKEIEIQSLEIQIAEKKIKELSAQKELRSTEILSLTEQLGERRNDLDKKRTELDGIVAETEEEEKQLIKEAEKASKKIEARLLGAYHRIRGNARNGLAVVSVQRDACGGCFNHIPPQLQMDIRLRKKITVCEHCGRILVDSDMETMMVN
ncbi:MAG: zinc ribbon domain-containing protein [Bacteroidia bacterium]|jgi:predicted  nucleic acid-binding Zn-ribbon protein